MAKRKKNLNLTVQLGWRRGGRERKGIHVNNELIVSACLLKCSVCVYVCIWKENRIRIKMMISSMKNFSYLKLLSLSFIYFLFIQPKALKFNEVTQNTFITLKLLYIFSHKISVCEQKKLVAKRIKWSNKQWNRTDRNIQTHLIENPNIQYIYKLATIVWYKESQTQTEILFIQHQFGDSKMIVNELWKKKI